MNRKQPLILISSSSDLQDARAALGLALRRDLRDMSLRINPFLWEDETEDGRTIQPGTPIQKQINEMLGNRVQMTIVMFGERIGEPLSGKPVEGTAELLEMWKTFGLCHPWPEDAADRSKALSEGRFPLTGTVYELLVALSLNADHDADDKRRKDALLNLRVGYVADKVIEADTAADVITLNNRRWFNSAADAPPPGSAAHVAWTHEKYNQQKQGVVNLIKALRKSPHGSFPFRFAGEAAMVEMLTHLAVRDLKNAYPAEVFEAVFKPDLSPFGVEDPMPFPDREDLREKLVNRLKDDAAAGHVLALLGKSGCGKSSLLQKGLLGADPPVVRGAIPVALRPTDISASPESTPLLQLLDVLADRLDGTIGTVPGLRNPPGGKISDRIGNALDSLEKALVRNRATLVLGIDQFEEVLDSAGLDDEKQRGQPRSWWQILHFIGRAAVRERIMVAVTLESQRYGRLEEMDVEGRTGIRLSLANVNFETSMVADFVRHTARSRRLPIAPRLPDAIERMVEAYESDRRRSVRGEPTSSFLPLLSLWLHRLFVKFRDRKGRAEDGTAGGAFSRTADLIGAEDLKHRGIDMRLGPLVSELVEDAWDEAGELTNVEDGEGMSVDPEVLTAFINDVARSSDAGRQLVQACRRDGGAFDLGWFVEVLKKSGMNEIPGVTPVTRRLPDRGVVENFFSGLVGVDEEGNMRLTEMPRENKTWSVSRLIDAHLRRRLLEPVIATNRVRLIHQAVVDNWPPAQDWYTAEKATLIAARNTRQAAHKADERADFAALSADAALVASAVSLLARKRAVWAADQEERLSPGDRDVRAFCLGLLAAAPDGMLGYDAGNDEKRPIAFEAARYNRVDVLRRWLDDAPQLLDAEDANGRSLLSHAAWFAPGVVDLLLARGAKAHGGSESHHPICGAIQSGNTDSLCALLTHYDGPEAVVGPNGSTMLHEAAFSPSLDSMRELLEHVSNPDVQMDAAMTPLLCAASRGRADIVELLVEADADPLVRDDKQSNVLHCAAWSNSAETVRLLRAWVADEDREALLFGRPDDGTDWQTPIETAAYAANPDVLKALLDWAGNDAIHRGDMRRHPLLAALGRGAQPVSQPVADRISSCVRVLLDHGGISSDVIEAALQWTQYLPDARRLLENHMILHSDNLESVRPETVLACITGERAGIAVEALRRRPAILDYRAEGGATGARTILQRAAPETLLFCLAEGLQPAENAELFRLEAALRVCRNALSGGSILSDQGPNASKVHLVFPGVAAERLHPIIASIVDAPNNERFRRLLSIGGGDSVRTLLHRLAIRGELDLYTDVVEAMRDPPPRDAYGRLPSAAAPPQMRGAFEAFELPQTTSGVH